MARTTAEILRDIQEVRGLNRILYQQLEAIGNLLDDTVQTVALAYVFNPLKAKELHTRISANDEKILQLTRELCA